MGRISCHLSQDKTTGIRQVIGQKRGEGTHPVIFLKAKQTGSGKGASCHFSQDGLLARSRDGGCHPVVSLEVRKTGRGWGAGILSSFSRCGYMQAGDS
jgi:hypothetical protein